MAVRTVVVGEKKLYVAGGLILDQQFIASLVAASKIYACCSTATSRPSFRPPTCSIQSGPIAAATLLRPLVERVEHQRREVFETISRGASAETFHALPLPGRENDVLGVLLIGSSRAGHWWRWRRPC